MAEKSPVVELRIAIAAEDYDGAMRFFGEALGLPLVRQWGEGDGRGALLEAGRATVEILAKAEADRIDMVEVGRPVGAPIRVAMEVADSPATAAALEASGGTRLGGPIDTPWGHRNVRLTGPGGLQITLFTVLKD